MKTRTLLGLALACGVAILLAGGVMLLRLSGDSGALEPVEIGEPAEVGDMTVVVLEFSESEGALDIVVRIGGVDDPDGGSDFRLIASARPAGRAEGPEPCIATTATPRDCHLHFDVSAADGESRVLTYARGEEQARWVLG